MLKRLFNWLFNRKPPVPKPPVFRSHYTTPEKNRVSLMDLKELTWDSEEYWSTFTFIYRTGKKVRFIVNRARQFEATRDKLLGILRENYQCQYQSLPVIHFSAVEDFLIKHGSKITEIAGTPEPHELKVTMSNGTDIGYVRLVATSNYDFSIIIDIIFSMGFVIAPYRGEMF